MDVDEPVDVDKPTYELADVDEPADEPVDVTSLGISPRTSRWMWTSRWT